MATSPRPCIKSTKTYSTEKFVRGSHTTHKNVTSFSKLDNQPASDSSGQTQEVTDVPGKAVPLNRPTHPAVSKICPELSPPSKLTQAADSRGCPELSPPSKLTQPADSRGCPEISTSYCADIHKPILITAAAVPAMSYASHDDDAQTEDRQKKSTEFGQQKLEQQRLDLHIQGHPELALPTSSSSSWPDDSPVWTVKINKVRETVGSTQGHAGHDESFLVAERIGPKQMKETHQGCVVDERIDRKQMKEVQNRAAEAQRRADDARSNREAAVKHQQKPTKATNAANLTPSNVNRLSPKHATNVVSHTRKFRNHSGDRSRDSSRSPTFSSLPSSPIKKPANLRDGPESRDKNKGRIFNSENLLNIQSKHKLTSRTALNISQQQEIVPVQQPMEAYDGGEATSTKNKQDGARNIQHKTKNIQSGTTNIRNEIKNIQNETRNLQNEAKKIRDGEKNKQDGMRNIQLRTKNMQHDKARNIQEKLEHIRVETRSVRDEEEVALSDDVINIPDAARNVDECRNVQADSKVVQDETKVDPSPKIKIQKTERSTSSDVQDVSSQPNTHFTLACHQDPSISRQEEKRTRDWEKTSDQPEESTILMASAPLHSCDEAEMADTMLCKEARHSRVTSELSETKLPTVTVIQSCGRSASPKSDSSQSDVRYTEVTDSSQHSPATADGQLLAVTKHSPATADGQLLASTKHSPATADGQLLAVTKHSPATADGQLLAVTKHSPAIADGQLLAVTKHSPATADGQLLAATKHSPATADGQLLAVTKHSPATADGQLLAVTNASMIHPESLVMLVGSGNCTNSSMSADEGHGTSVNDTFKTHFDGPSSYSCDRTTAHPAADRETLNFQQWTTPSSKPRNIVQERTSESIAEMNQLWHMIRPERQDSSNREVGTHMGRVLNKEVGTDVSKLRSMKLQDSSFMDKSELDLDSLILLLPQLEKEYQGSSFMVQLMGDELGPSHEYESHDDDDEKKDLYEEKLERALRESEHLLAELSLLSK